MTWRNLSLANLGVWAIGLAALFVGFDLTVTQVLGIAALAHGVTPWHPRSISLAMSEELGDKREWH